MHTTSLCVALQWHLHHFKSNSRETWCVILVSESWHILLRITAHPRGAFISVGDCTPTEKDLLLLTTCRSGSLLDWDKLAHVTQSVLFQCIYACVARSAGWRKNSQNSLRKLRTPVIFSQGAIASDWDKITGVPIKIQHSKFLSYP